MGEKSKEKARGRGGRNTKKEKQKAGKQGNMVLSEEKGKLN